ncbi:hypothetical protein EFR29_05420 [Lactobacillus delbrueckii subsp. lactis]|nr:hypothetical protein [Lactobacillus delbrueckii subsp. lactis]MCT3520270.1 hypothetical protein [Lactobacillus delbrueckii subsp. lactis]
MKMPRTKNIKTIEAEISQTEEQLRRLKERCDKASQKLDALYELKKHREQEELLKAIDKSTRTKAEILTFLESQKSCIKEIRLAENLPSVWLEL